MKDLTLSTPQTQTRPDKYGVTRKRNVNIRIYMDITMREF
jgi:hypothetical protein